MVRASDVGDDRRITGDHPMIPEFITMSRPAFDRLFVLAKWYQEEPPGENFGDSFHQNVSEIVTNIVEAECPGTPAVRDGAGNCGVSDDGKLWLFVYDDDVDETISIEVRCYE